jgi:hypothetical protein
MKNDPGKPFFSGGGLTFYIVIVCVLGFGILCITASAFVGLMLALVIGISFVLFILMNTYHMSIYDDRVIVRDLLSYKVQCLDLHSVDGFIYEYKGYGPYKSAGFGCRIAGKKFLVEVHLGNSLSKCIARLLDQGISVKYDVDSQDLLERLVTSVDRYRVNRS